jgi:ADP-dependent NAD(P)H-hydrate dehydratase / NAD(P)H-hydrate epimerase
MKIVTVSQMQQAEIDCSKFGISTDMLMENAGKAVGEETRNVIGDLPKQNVLVLVGPGNNGGDGLVAARTLYDLGTGRVKVYLCGMRPENDQHLEEVKKRSIHIQSIDDDPNLIKFKEWLSEATVVLDSVFGTGKVRPFFSTLAKILNLVNEARGARSNLLVIALDLPSGLNADTGSVDPATPFSDLTITLGFPKVGLFNLPGAERAGTIITVDIGIPYKVVDYVNTELVTAEMVKAILPARPLVSHKGTYGKVLAFVGSTNYSGAAYLSCMGAIRAGAGLTTLAIARSLQPVLATKLTEVTYLPLPESEPGIISAEASGLISQQVPQYDVLLMGCGIGQDPSITDLIKSVLLNQGSKWPPVVLDADGINTLSGIADWQKLYPDEAVFTPHAGEMARLLNTSISEVQNNRLDIARNAAIKWNKIMVLKGAYTVIASPDGKVRVSPFANPGLATAGTGDVLAGTIASFVAQGLGLFDAAVCGVYLQGLAGEMVKSEMGDTGMLASDLLPVLPLAIRQLKQV